MNDKQFQALEERKKQSCQQWADKRAFICERFPVGGIGAEIGVLWGQFSEKILQIAKPRILYLVDPWSHDDRFGNRTPEQMEEIYQITKRKFLEIDELTIFRKKSSVFFDWRNGKTLDFVYIDGDHEYEAVLSDLDGAWKCVKPGGIIAGDDYGENISHWGDTVKRAVDDFCHAEGVAPEIIEIPGEKAKQFLIKR